MGGPATRPILLYEKWPANNAFYCKGRAISGPDRGQFYCAVSMIVISSVLFLVFVCPYLITRLSPAIIVVHLYVLVLSLVSLFICAFMDPGIIPRATNPEYIIGKSHDAMFVFPKPTDGVIPPKPIIMNGKSFSLKYCDTCLIYRPPRCSHCAVCNNCVENFDHHCVWIGNCIAKRNYRYFVVFVNSVTVLCVYMFVFSLTNLLLRWADYGSDGWNDFWHAIGDSPVSVLLVFFTFFIFFSVGALTSYHSYLIINNATTNEELKGIPKGGSIYSRGLLHNIGRAYFPPYWHGYINFRKLTIEQNEAPPIPAPEVSTPAHILVQSSPTESAIMT